MRHRVVFPLLFSLVFLLPNVVFPMHISEGTLPVSWSLVWFGASVPFLALGLRRLAAISRSDLSVKPLAGMMAAVVFVISCMPIPIPAVGTCSHPCGTGLAAVVLGPSLSVVVAGVALLIQALFLSHGGVTTWGANLFAMGVVGSFTGFLAFRGVRLLGGGPVAAAFAAGMISDWCTYGATSVILAAGLKGSAPFLPLAGQIALAFVPTQLPLGIIEGVISSGMVSLLMKKRPDLLARTALSAMGGK